ncbi:MAG: phosphate ABC transporter ATP-binding protein [Nitrospinae bacterium]|nr:phosphate ABC transporter ATP-binding protein [Nitrospinota bacterium]
MSRMEQAIDELEGTAVIARNVNFYYGIVQALFGVSLEIKPKQITAFIGPSGCGKSTLLRCFNRMNEVLLGTRLEGDILVHGTDVYREGTRLETLRKRVGMVFQKSNPFPMTIYDNIAFGPRMRGIKDKSTLGEVVERSLKQADLWHEVKDRLNNHAQGLSGGQQQRLCIARTLANEPEIILMDEPASALDPISTSKIEETIQELRNLYTIVIVTHNLQQAARCSDHTAFFYMGRLVEMGATSRIFQNPAQKRTEDYISGKFG